MKILKIQVEKKKDSLVLRLTGDIDENAVFQDIELGASKAVTIDLGGIEMINSGGSREWIKWTHSISRTIPVKFLNCSPVFMDYVNMIEGFIPAHGSIETFHLPYYCENCDLITNKTYESNKIKTVAKDVALSLECPKCKKAAKVDVVFPSFFKFLGRA